MRMSNLDGKLVRVVSNIFCDDKIIVNSGQTFIWDDSTTDQNVDGELVFIEEDEIELVDE